MKKVLSIFLAMLMIISTIPISFAETIDEFLESEEFKENGYTYTVNNGEATITDADAHIIGGDLIIPTTLGGYRVTKIGAQAFSGHAIVCQYERTGNDITSVVIHSGVTEIGYKAFNECIYLESITIKGVTKIGESAFYGCKRLESINIKGVTEIGSGAFDGCELLESITIEDENIMYIAPNAFDDTVWFANQPDGIVYIKKIALTYKGEAIETDTTIEIKDGTKSVMFGTSSMFDLETVGTFSVNIVFPESLEFISSDTVVALSFFNNIFLDENNCHFSVENGVLYNKDKTKLLAITLPIRLANIVTIPEGVEKIGDYAFFANGIEQINFPTSLKEIGTAAFASCSLKEVVIPENVEIIGSSAFAICEYLENVTINSSNLKEIKDNAFRHCISLKNVTLNSVEKIGAYAFYENSELEKIEFGENLKYIEEQAFVFCTSLKELVFPESLISIDTYAFYACIALESLSFGVDTKEISAFAFQYCQNIKEITFSEGIENIGNGAFFINMTTEITIPKSVQNIGRYAFGFNLDDTEEDLIKTEDFTIYGYSNTAAEDYADAYDFIFISLDSEHQHSYTYVESTKATCTENGYDIYKCDTCGRLRKVIVEEAYGHDDEYVSEKKSTCTENGYTSGYSCSICGEILSGQETIKASGHSFIYISNSEPDHWNDGYEIWQCKNCGEYKNIKNADKTPCIDEDANGYCDFCNNLLDAVAACDHLCHKDGFLGFIWKMIRLLYSLFGTNKNCECGAAHY